jgi:hypothetical protein
MQLRSSDNTTPLLKTQAGYTPDNDHSTTSEIECQRQIRRGVTMIKEELIHQKGVVSTRNNTLA